MMRRNRRGNIVYTVLITPVILAAAALVVDLGQARVGKAQLQAVADSVAWSGAGYLDGTEAGTTAAVQGALAVAAANGVYGEDIDLDAGDVELGYWDQDASTFVASSDPAVVNAVRVVPRSTLPTYFARAVLSTDSLDVGASATAVRQRFGTGLTECFMPLAVPDCVVSGTDEATLKDMDFRLSPAGIDNTGWATFTEYGSPNAAGLANQIVDCTYAGAASIDDTVWLDNGVKSSTLLALADAIDASTTTWDSGVYGVQPAQHPDSAVASYGNVLERPIFVFEGTPDYCAGSGSWTETAMPITGFAWGAVYDVAATGADKNIKMRLDLERVHEIGQGTGGEDYGVVTYGTRLVQ